MELMEYYRRGGEWREGILTYISEWIVKQGRLIYCDERKVFCEERGEIIELGLTIEDWEMLKRRFRDEGQAAKNPEPVAAQAPPMSPSQAPREAQEGCCTQ